MAATETAHGADLIPGLRPQRQTLGRTVIKWITSTDHKTIGYMYLITSFFWFAVGGILALLIRAELFMPASRSCRARSSTTSSSRCTARSCCCCSRPRCSPASPT